MNCYTKLWNSLELAKRRRMDMRFGTWKVRHVHWKQSQQKQHGTGVALNQQHYVFIHGNGNANHELGKGFSVYEAHPQSKFPWGHVQKQNTIAWKYLLQQIQHVFSFFPTYSPPELRHLSYRGTNFCILCRWSLPPGIGTTVFWCQLLRHPPGAQFP
jgi:hypothetical protein